MSAPDRPVQDLIAEVIGRTMVLRTSPAEIAAAVVAACQEATVAQQAELTGSEVRRDRWTRLGDNGRFVEVTGACLFGPWREDPS